MVKAFILGLKGESVQTFNDVGERIPVTTIHTGECYLIDVKTTEKDGYQAVVLGFSLAKHMRKSRHGLVAKAGLKTPLRFIKEIRIDKKNGTIEIIEKDKKKGIKIGECEITTGDAIKPSEIFKEGENVNVTGTSKGKGFQGVVKRHGFHGGPRTHGQSDRERAPGSIGQSTTPGRVFKGMKMAGRMGADTVTVQGLRVVGVDESYIKVKGLVPGHKNGLLIVRA